MTKKERVAAGKGQGSDLKRRDWCMTIFVQPEGMEHPRTEEDVDEILGGFRWCGQIEEGHKKHHPHFQIYAVAPNAIHWSSLKKRLPPDVHFEPRSAPHAWQAVAYAVKEDTRIEGPFWHGLSPADAEPHAGQRTDLTELADRIKSGESVDSILRGDDSAKLARCLRWARELEAAVKAEREDRFLTEKRDVTVHYWFGAPGIGKTTTVLDSDLDVFQPTLGPDGYRWDAYAGEPAILLDEFEGEKQVRIDVIDRLLQGFKGTRLPARYRDHIAAYTEIFILSNFPPESLYHGDKRWLRRLTDVRHLTRATLPDPDSLHDIEAPIDNRKLDIFGAPIEPLSEDERIAFDLIFDEEESWHTI